MRSEREIKRMAMMATEIDWRMGYGQVAHALLWALSLHSDPPVHDNEVESEMLLAIETELEKQYGKSSSSVKK